MVNPVFQEEKPLGLVDVKEALDNIEKRDTELNYRSNKAKEFVANFADILNKVQKEELHKKLVDLNLTRLKEEHIVKIIDFLPTTETDLKVVLQAYPLSMPKKDMTAIIDVVKGYA